MIFISFLSRRKTALQRQCLAVLCCVLALTASSNTASAASITVQVVDAAGAPAPNAVVYAEPVGGQTVPKNLKPTEVEQKNIHFYPLVTVVQAGTPVAFPNHDKVRHQVYSFSPAKTFELKLYAGVPSSPIVFDKTGTVVLGCNIHDEMVAYIQVVDTPYFGKTDMSGTVKLDGLVNGKYLLKAWYFRMAPNEAPSELPFTVQGADLSLSTKLRVKAVPVE